ncbi:hypothetical protein MTR_5g010850 [Medicago truncatula]|uniref:Uncharacterized protein n=1 Tax=Medicago truncatula TaxID=3880 RepID=G7KDH3_MEDTR|nr:hypothetical protein MTR_5g010850 [Medicago truncatula]
MPTTLSRTSPQLKITPSVYDFPIESARAMFMHIVMDYFIDDHGIEVVDSDVD